METSIPSADTELKARHRKMWASGDYPSMVETFLLPLGPRLVEACQIGPGMRVLDVAAGTGNASIAAAQAGADVTASDLTPELLEAGKARAQDAGVELEWVEADAEQLPFEDGSFDVVMSSIGAMFAPRHQQVADELVRVCRPGGTIAMLCWTPEGMLGELFRTIKPFAPPPPPGAQPPPLWGSEQHLSGLFGDRVAFHTLERDVLEITAFEHARDYGEHFIAYYGPAIAARANASRDGREAQFDEAIGQFCDEWNRGTAAGARCEKQYLVACGSKQEARPRTRVSPGAALRGGSRRLRYSRRPDATSVTPGSRARRRSSRRAASHRAARRAAPPAPPAAATRGCASAARRGPTCASTTRRSRR